MNRSLLLLLLAVTLLACSHARRPGQVVDAPAAPAEEEEDQPVSSVQYLNWTIDWDRSAREQNDGELLYPVR
jgi:hypothetical protein